MQNRHEYDVRDSAKVKVEFSLESKEEFAKYLKLLFDDLLARDFKSNETDMQKRQAGKNWKIDQITFQRVSYFEETIIIPD